MWGILLIGVGLSMQTPGVGPLADANELYQRQEYRLAARKYEEALGFDPGLTAPYFYLANSYENAFRPTRRGDPDNDACLAKAEKSITCSRRTALPTMRCSLVSCSIWPPCIASTS